MDIPEIGFGTYKLLDDTYQMVLNSLKHGYRHVDTAFIYKNEEAVGKAIKDSGIKREDIFLTTKVWIKDIVKGRQGIINGVKRSLKRLDTDYIDLILLHAPIEDRLVESWQTMEDIKKGLINDLENKVRHIGVSNYKIRDLEVIMNPNMFRIKPYCNQIEVHPFLQRRELVRYCKNNSIKIVAHSSLLQGQKHDDEQLNLIASKYNCRVSELLLNWALDKDFVVIPRTSKNEHMEINFNRDKKINHDAFYELDLIYNKDREFTLFSKYL